MSYSFKEKRMDTDPSKILFTSMPKLYSPYVDMEDRPLRCFPTHQHELLIVPHKSLDRRLPRNSYHISLKISISKQRAIKALAYISILSRANQSFFLIMEKLLLNFWTFEYEPGAGCTS